MLEIKNTVTEMKNAFDRLISRLVVAEERIHENQKMKRTKTGKKNRIGYPRIVAQLQKI